MTVAAPSNQPSIHGCARPRCASDFVSTSPTVSICLRGCAEAHEAWQCFRHVLECRLAVGVESSRRLGELLGKSCRP